VKSILEDIHEPREKEKISRLNLISITATVSAFFCYVTLPLTMDEQSWYLQYPSGMNFSFGELNAYANGAGDDIPGRFSPIKRYFIYAYSLIGIRLAPEISISLQQYKTIVFLILLSLTFLSLRFFVQSLQFKTGTGFARLNPTFVNKITLLTALIFGALGNMRYPHSGLISYPTLTYPPLILALFFAGASLRLLRMHVKDSRSLRNWMLLAVTAVFLALWSNWFYELSMIAIVAVCSAIFREILIAKSSRERVLAATHFTTYGMLFILVLIPTHFITSRECANQECYEGLILSPSTIPNTFFWNIVNPLPLIGIFQDFTTSAFSKWFNPLILASTFAIGVLVVLAIALNVDFVVKRFYIKENTPRKDLFFGILYVPASIALTSALMMSLSVNAAKIVEFGRPYRQTPIVWIFYSLLIALILVFFWRNSFRFKFAILPLLLLITCLQLSANYFQSHELSNSNRTVFVNSLYSLLIQPTDPNYANQNQARCSLMESIGSESKTGRKFLPLANNYTLWRHKVEFCVAE
jgi:hypothetical protein